MEVFLYNRDLTTPQLDEVLTDRVQNLQFSTLLNGGFGMASFVLDGDIGEAWTWLTEKQFYRLLIKDVAQTLFEGRIQGIAIVKGGFRIVAYGYWASLLDQVENTAYNTTADVAIKAALTAHSPLINSDQSNIAAPDVTIDSAADVSYVDITIQDLVKKLLAFGDTSDNTWYFAIWEDRIPYMFAKSVATIDWTVRLEDLEDFELEHLTDDLWNSVYAIYDVGGVLTRTVTANNTDSQKKYGDGTNDLVRLYAIPQLGTVAAASAQAARDVFLEKHREIFPTFEILVLGDRVFNSDGIAYPSSWVRAGDVIRITDLVPATGELDQVVADALRTFYILETNYDADRRTNSLKVDAEKKSLDSILINI